MTGRFNWRVFAFGLALAILAGVAALAVMLRFIPSLGSSIVGNIAQVLKTDEIPSSLKPPPCGTWAEISPMQSVSSPVHQDCRLQELVKAEALAGPTRGVSKPSAPKQPIAKPRNDPIEALINKSVDPYALLVNAPLEAIAGAPFNVDIIIQAAIDQNLQQVADISRRDLARQDIEVTPDVQVILQGSGFEINGEESAWRRLTRRSPSLWQWSLTASGEGEKILTIVVRGKVRLKDDDERWFDAFITTRKVNVMVPTLQRAFAAAESAQKIADVLQSLWLVLSGVFAAFGTFALRQMRRMNRQQSSNPT